MTDRSLRWLQYAEIHTSPDLSGRSYVQMMMNLMDGLTAIGTPHRCTIVLPRRGGTFDWSDSMFEGRNVDPWETNEDWSLNWEWPPITVRMMDPFLPKRGKVLFDFVLSEKYLHSATLAAPFHIRAGQWRQAIEIPIVTWIDETTLGRRNPQLGLDGSIGLLAASAMTGPILVLNDYDLDEVERVLRQTLTPAWVKVILERSHVVRPTADLSRIDARFDRYEQERTQRAEMGKTTVFHGGSLGEGARRVPIIADAIETLRAEGVNVEGRFKTQHRRGNAPDLVRRMEHCGTVEMEVFHDRYVESFGEGDILYMGVEYNGTGIGYMEGIRSGMIPLAIDEVWTRDRLPDHYPFIVKPDQVTEALRMMIGRLPQIREQWQQKLRGALHPFTPQETARSFTDALSAILEPVRERNLDVVTDVKPPFSLLQAAVMEKAWTKVEGTGMLYEAMRVRSKKDTNFKYVTPMSLRLMMIALGYVDVCDGPDLHMTRRQ